MTQARRWAFTWFDPEGVPPEFDDSWMSYLVVGNEVCPDTGRQHWQGYVETKAKITVAGIKRKGGLWETVHLERAVASSQENFEYCTKGGDQYLEWGEPMQAGKRSDLFALGAAITAGEASVADVLVENPHAFHVYGRTLDRLEDLRWATMSRGAWAPPQVFWFYGGTGTGKSRTAMEEATALNVPVYRHTWDDNGWWDLYRGETAIIFDEFRAQVPFHQLLAWLDGYPINVKRRGRAPLPFMATHIWITSHTSPAVNYPNMLEDIKQLTRRITKIVHFSDPFNE